MKYKTKITLLILLKWAIILIWLALFVAFIAKAIEGEYSKLLCIFFFGVWPFIIIIPLSLLIEPKIDELKGEE